MLEKMVNDGASFIDVGGESTRPGAKPVSAHEEISRVIPVVEVKFQENRFIVRHQKFVNDGVWYSVRCKGN